MMESYNHLVSFTIIFLGGGGLYWQGQRHWHGGLSPKQRLPHQITEIFSAMSRRQDYGQEAGAKTSVAKGEESSHLPQQVWNFNFYKFYKINFNKFLFYYIFIFHFLFYLTIILGCCLLKQPIFRFFCICYLPSSWKINFVNKI